MQKKKIGLLFSCLVVPFIAGAVGSLFTFKAIPTWYAGLNKPSFNPPNAIFGPVWTLLYILMGIALYLVIIKNKKVKPAVVFFIIQLILNSLWSIIFFGLKNPTGALMEIMVLWLAIIVTIFYFWKISRAAAYLLLPYLAWVSFASVLNYFIVILN